MNNVDEQSLVRWQLEATVSAQKAALDQMIMNQHKLRVDLMCANMAAAHAYLKPQEPKLTQLGNSSSVPEHMKTTLMFRNLPNDYSRDDLVQLLVDQGFKGKFNFIYVPVDFRRFAGLGYAFVNFETNEDALHARTTFKGWKTWTVNSKKVCQPVWGEPLQGLDVHIERYRNSPVMHDDVPAEHKPLFLKNGEVQVFPAPTKRIRPPRVKRNPTAGGQDGNLEAAVEI